MWRPQLLAELRLLQASHNLLTAGTVGSLFLLYQATRDPKYEKRGWRILREV